MTDDAEVVFLGLNDAGRRIYDWLCDRGDVSVRALLTTAGQLDLVERLEPDYLVSCGYRHIVPPEVLSVPDRGCLNVHPAYLPYNRGANPNVWSIVEGTPAGVTLHYMDEDIDTGAIIERREVETDFADTGKDLHHRLEDAQFDLFVDAWPRVVAGDVDPVEQDPDRGTHHVTDEFEELCELDPDVEYGVRELLDRLRALTFPPHDNARIEVDGETYHVEVRVERA